MHSYFKIGMELNMEISPKRRRGDRRDATLVRDLDSMHVFMPIMMPNRADNEAFIQELVDMSAVEAYLEKKNAQSPEYKYTFFHVILAALSRTIEMRPRMNRFIIGNRYFDRDNITFSFIVKKAFSDNADESVMILKYDPASEKAAIDMIHDKICDFVFSVRKSNKKDGGNRLLDECSCIFRSVCQRLHRQESD